MPDAEQKKIVVNEFKFITQRDQFPGFIDQEILINLRESGIEMKGLVGVAADEVIQGIEGVEDKMRVHFIGQRLEFGLRALPVELIHNARIDLPLFGEEQNFIDEGKDDDCGYADDDKALDQYSVEGFAGKLDPDQGGKSAGTGGVKSGNKTDGGDPAEYLAEGSVQGAQPPVNPVAACPDNGGSGDEKQIGGNQFNRVIPFIGDDPRQQRQAKPKEGNENRFQ